MKKLNGHQLRTISYHTCRRPIYQIKKLSMPRRGSDAAGNGNREQGAKTEGTGGAEGRAGGATAVVRGKGTAPSPSPRLLTAESRLAQEKVWVEDLPEYYHAEVMKGGSGFVWSFRVSGLQGTLYQVGVLVSTCLTY